MSICIVEDQTDDLEQQHRAADNAQTVEDEDGFDVIPELEDIPYDEEAWYGYDKKDAAESSEEGDQEKHWRVHAMQQLDEQIAKARLAAETASSDAAVQESPCNMEHYAASLARAVVCTSRHSSTQNFPWETGYAGLVLGGSTSSLDPFTGLYVYGPVPPIPNETPPSSNSQPDAKRIKTTSRTTEGPAYLHVARKLKDIEWPVAKEALRQKAFARWRMILEVNPQAFACMRKLLTMTSELKPEEEIRQNICDIFSNKKTGTLLKRAGTLIQYMAWHYTQADVGPAFPVTEELAYNYVQHLRRKKRGATAPDSFKSAVTFCHFVLGMVINDDLLTSPRVRGAAFASLLTKRKLKQRDELEVSYVLALEFMLFQAEDPKDAIAAGFFLYCIYGRCRGADAQNTVDLIADWDEKGFGFLEGSCDDSKTSNSAQKRTMFLPIVCPTPGIGTRSWGPTWLRLRESEGMECGKGIPLLPAVNVNGEWASTPITNEDASKWLLELIKRGTDVPVNGNIGFHSLKRTGLTWCAKWGVHKSLRRTLGYHVKAGDVSTFTYSRECQVEALRAFIVVLTAIRRSSFHPDITRSGRFEAETLGEDLAFSPSSDDGAEENKPGTDVQEKDTPGSLEQNDEEKESETEDSSSSDRSTDSDSRCSDEQNKEDNLVAKITGVILSSCKRDLTNLTLYQHKDGMIHSADSSDFNRLACKRPISQRFTPFTLDSGFDWPLCSQCFRK